MNDGPKIACTQVFTVCTMGRVLARENHHSPPPSSHRQRRLMKLCGPQTMHTYRKMLKYIGDVVERISRIVWRRLHCRRRR